VSKFVCFKQRLFNDTKLILVVCCLLQASWAYCRLLAWLSVAYWSGLLAWMFVGCFLIRLPAGLLGLLPHIGLAYCGLLVRLIGLAYCKTLSAY
jgi:hypothetical protein